MTLNVGDTPAKQKRREIEQDIAVVDLRKKPLDEQISELNANAKSVPALREQVAALTKAVSYLLERDRER